MCNEHTNNSYLCRVIILKKYLTGGQVELDKNKDGKITGEDFKLMKAKKKSMYAQNGAMVKALKKYAIGGETDPPTTNLKEVTTIGKKEKPHLTKTFEWKGDSLNEAINEVNTFIRNKGNWASSDYPKRNALMKDAEKMLKLGMFGNLDSLLQKEINAYRPGTFDMRRFKGYQKVAPSKVVDGKFKQVEGEEAETISRIQEKNPEAGLKPGRYTIRK